ncbi:hypothetical protein TrVGV298_008718 [Trichoderma virens]|nr:hypothetical protein TrVGV298_008718 [Trichoderma virens]
MGLDGFRAVIWLVPNPTLGSAGGTTSGLDLRTTTSTLLRPKHGWKDDACENPDPTQAWPLHAFSPKAAIPSLQPYRRHLLAVCFHSFSSSSPSSFLGPLFGLPIPASMSPAASTQHPEPRTQNPEPSRLKFATLRMGPFIAVDRPREESALVRPRHIEIPKQFELTKLHCSDSLALPAMSKADVRPWPSLNSADCNGFQLGLKSTSYEVPTVRAGVEPCIPDISTNFEYIQVYLGYRGSSKGGLKAVNQRLGIRPCEGSQLN